jgi:hypothetical protein
VIDRGGGATAEKQAVAKSLACSLTAGIVREFDGNGKVQWLCLARLFIYA